MFLWHPPTTASELLSTLTWWATFFAIRLLSSKVHYRSFTLVFLPLPRLLLPSLRYTLSHFEDNMAITQLPFLLNLVFFFLSDLCYSKSKESMSLFSQAPNKAKLADISSFKCLLFSMTNKDFKCSTDALVVLNIIWELSGLNLSGQRFLV